HETGSQSHHVRVRKASGAGTIPATQRRTRRMLPSPPARATTDASPLPPHFRRLPVTRCSRRSFLVSSAGVFATLPAATYRASLLAQEKPSEAVRVGCIGVGGQGRGNMNAIKKNVVAVCDVDRDHVAGAAKELEKSNIKAQTFADYRKLIALK